MTAALIAMAFLLGCVLGLVGGFQFAMLGVKGNIADGLLNVVKPDEKTAKKARPDLDVPAFLKKDCGPNGAFE